MLPANVKVVNRVYIFRTLTGKYRYGSALRRVRAPCYNKVHERFSSPCDAENMRDLDD
jgi:hypothetical protein